MLSFLVDGGGGEKGLTASWVPSAYGETHRLVSVNQYEVPGWNQVYDMLLSLAEQIRLSGYRPDVVVGVIRGGLVPARVLTDLLEVPLLGTLQVEFYVGLGETSAAPVLRQGLALSVVGRRVLLVDDIADSGRSLELAKSYLLSQGAAELRVAVLYYKPGSVVKPEFYAQETRSWVVFPWETQETLREILQHKEADDAKLEIAKLIEAGFPKHLADRLLATMQEQC